MTVALGLWGWADADRQVDDIHLDGWTRLYKTLTLFTGEDGGLFDVPWSLDAARLLAPIIASASLVVAVISGMSERLQAAGARRATGHLVVVGPTTIGPDHPFVMAERRCPVVVHVTSATEGHHPGWLTIRAEVPPHSWIGPTRADRAGALVIAGVDNETALAATLAAIPMCPAAAIHVDMPSLEGMLQLGLLAMLRHPDVDVRVGSTTVLALHRGVRHLLGDLRPRIRSRVFVVIGDGDLLVQVSSLLQKSLKRANALDDCPVADDQVIEYSADGGHPPEALSGLCRDCEGAETILVAIDPLPQACAGALMEFGLRLPHATIRVIDFGAAPTSIDTSHAGESSLLEDAAERGIASAIAARTGHPTESARVRRAMATLWADGWRFQLGDRRHRIRRADVEAIQAAGLSDEKSARALQPALLHIGIEAVPPTHRDDDGVPT